MNRKTCIAISFIVLYGVALLKPAVPLIDYYLEMEAYLEQCTNKSRPELHCNGQCILMQKLKALEQDTETPVPPSPVKVNFQEYPIGFVNAHVLADRGIPNHIIHHSGYASPAEQSFHRDIFHPPSVC